MPLYEYACEKCGKVFEVMQKFADEPLTVHADCGGKVDRLISAPALHFKGSGFYITDYARGNGNANAPRSSDSKSSSEGSKSESSSTSDTSKSDSKPATPAPAATTTSSSSDSKS